jgi:hypothetical protein
MRHAIDNFPETRFPNGRSPKLTQEMADEMRRLRNAGMMQHDIAARFGVNQGRVSEVLSGKRFPPRAAYRLKGEPAPTE